MIPVKNKIIVRCNLKQKEQMIVGNSFLKMCPFYDPNYRERSPVICEVVIGNNYTPCGTIILAHHNNFYLPSPFHIGDDLFSIPFKGTILFATVNPEGDLTPLDGNIICERVVVETTLPLPPEFQKTHIDRALVIDGRGTHYLPGQTIFHRPNAGYTIVYLWNGIEKRVTKVYQDQIIGVLN